MVCWSLNLILHSSEGCNMRQVLSVKMPCFELNCNVLVSSRLDYCNALLTGLPAFVLRPLQMIQNAAARLVSNQPKRAHVTPLLIDLHWLPVAARIKFKSLMLAYRVLTGSAP